MRVTGRNHSRIAAATASLVAWLLPLVSGISVPTGKLTPITPARPTPRTVNPHAPANPAPVVEYSQDNPEPPPLDPSYVPQTFNYFDTLAKHHIYYFPVRYRNFNALSNHIEYEPPQKFNGHTLGKNVGYKPFKQQLTVPYYPVWASQQYNIPPSNQQNNQENQYNNEVNNQYSQPGQYNNEVNNQYNRANQYNNQANQYNNQVNQPNNQYNHVTNQVSNQDYNNQYNPQVTQQQQQQQYEAVSTQSSPASTAPAASQAPQVPQTPQVPKVDYSTGKGSYDVTGKGGSKSEYYTKEDWSKKTSYPKKVLSSRNSKFPGKF